MADILSQEEIDTLLNVDDNTTKFFKLKKLLNTSIEKALLNLSFDLNCDRFLKAEFNEYKSKFLYDIDELNLLEQKILKIDFKIINGKISSQHTIYVNDILFKNFSISNKLEKEITMKKIILNLIDNIYYHSNNDSYMEQLIEDMCLTMDLKKRFKVLDLNHSHLYFKFVEILNWRFS